jgi:hypothetical protein
MLQDEDTIALIQTFRIQYQQQYIKDFAQWGNIVDAGLLIEDPSLSLEEIFFHALHNKGKRTLKVLRKLRWLNERNMLLSTAPSGVNSAFQNVALWYQKFTEEKTAIIQGKIHNFTNIPMPKVGGNLIDFFCNAYTCHLSQQLKIFGATWRMPGLLFLDNPHLNLYKIFFHALYAGGERSLYTLQLKLGWFDANGKIINPRNEIYDAIFTVTRIMHHRNTQHRLDCPVLIAPTTVPTVAIDTAATDTELPHAGEPEQTSQTGYMPYYQVRSLGADEVLPADTPEAHLETMRKNRVSSKNLLQLGKTAASKIGLF